MKNINKIKDPNATKHKLMLVIVAAVAILGASYIVFSKASTAYRNPYSCPSRPILSTSTGGSQPTCTKYVQYVIGGITVDGNYGPNTKLAVQKFQFNYKVSNSGCGSSYSSCDGIVGSATWTKLDQVNASKTQAAQQPAPAPAPAPSPTGNVVCGALTSTTISTSVSWSNSGSAGAQLYRNNTKIAGWTPTSGSTSFNSTGLAPATSYSFVLKSGTATLKSITCKTLVKPTGSLACSTSTATAITLKVVYSNSDGITGLFRATTQSTTYPKGSGNTTYNSTGLAANTSYTFSLKSGATVLGSATCKTAAPGATTTNSTTTPSPASSPSDPDEVAFLEDDDEDYYDDPDADSDTDANSSSDDSDNDSSNNDDDDSDSKGSDDDGSGGDSNGSDDSGAGSNNGSSEQGSDNKSNEAGATNIYGTKVSTTEAVAGGLGVITLLMVAVFVWLYIHGHRMNKGQPYAQGAYNAADYGPVQTGVEQPVLNSSIAPAVVAPYDTRVFVTPTITPPVAPMSTGQIAPPVASNKMESIINNTFYPGQTQATVTPVAPKNEPLDMFEVADKYPTSFGNSHVVSPLTSTATDTRVAAPVNEPMPSVIPVIPLQPVELEPIATADGTLNLHPTAPPDQLIPLPPMPAQDTPVGMTDSEPNILRPSN